MTLALASFRAALTPPWVKNELWCRAQAVPSLDLRFADNKSLTDAVTGASLVTFTRASSGTFVGSAGVLQTAATDVPRFDHNPTTGESLGLLVEEARTNSITNNTMVGAVAGTPGTLPTGWPFQSAGVLGLAVSIVGTGAESGIAYLDWRISGTASANTSATICFGRGSALTAQTWTASSYLKLAAGSLSGVTGMTLDLIEETAVNVFIAGAQYSITLPTTAPLVTQRPAASRTLTGGATVALLRTNLSVNVSSGSTVDFTLRIGLPQLEQGAFATSAIPTTTAAATRSADVASITGSNFSSWYNQTEGTVFAETQLLTNASNYIASFTDNTGNNHHFLRYAASQYQVFSTVGGAANTAIYETTGNNVLDIKNAYAIRSGQEWRIVTKGVFGAFSSVTSATPIVDRLIIAGSQLSGAPGSLRLRRLTYWPPRLANTTLQAITR